MMNIKILQPFVPHYREEFFLELSKVHRTEILTFDEKEVSKSNFKQGHFVTTNIKHFKVSSLLFYSPYPFMNKDCDIMVLMLSITHLTTWLLLLLKPFHKKKIILWGHGISIHNYLEETENVNIFRKWMIEHADLVWFYTDQERQLWQKRIPKLRAVGLGNTLSNTSQILNLPIVSSRKQLKKKYNIFHKRILIYCARFNEAGRREDLLLDLVIRLKDADVGVIIIGDGNLKPDFSAFNYVYDFGALYDIDIKTELFQIADVYFQPGWVGLSIVEAMAYSKPILTFKRAKNIPQCVEYSYIIDGYNGVILENMESAIAVIIESSDEFFLKLGGGARDYVNSNLQLSKMIEVVNKSILDI